MLNRRFPIGALALSACAVLLAACSPSSEESVPPSSAEVDAGEVNIYSARQEVLIKPLLDRFSEQTGIQVNLVAGRADELMQRLQAEGRNTRADVLLTVDAGNLHRATEAGFFQSIDSAVLQASVPEAYRDAEGRWFGLSMRARPIMYAKERVDPTSLANYADLVEPEWQGRICIRSSSNVYNQSMVAAMIAHDGVEATQQWVNGVVANFARPPQGGDRDQIRAVAAGQCDVALANTYYLGAMLAAGEGADYEVARQIGIVWADQDGHGTHVNISGAGVTVHARNRDNAIRLLEFLVSDEAQQWYAEANQEYPVKPGVEASEILRGFGEFKADAISLGGIGEHYPEAVRVMDRAGWR